MKTPEDMTQDASSQNQQDRVHNSQSNGRELVKEVFNSPFKVVQTDNDILLVMGRHVVKRGFDSVQQAISYVRKRDWELILTASAIYNEYINEEKLKKNESK